MKGKLALLLIIVMFFNTGCYNYKDIEDIVFCTSIIIDVSESGDLILYMRALKGVKSLEETEVSGQIINFREQGETIFECIRTATLNSNAKINFSQNKAIIFTEEAAKLGINNYLDMLERDQEFNLRTVLVVYKGDINELVDINLGEEKNIGIYLLDTCENGEKKSGRAKSAYINDIYNQIYGAGNAYTIPIFEIEEVVSQIKLGITGTGIFKEGQLIETLTENETIWYNLLTDNIGTVIIEIPHFNDPEKLIVLEVLKCTVKTETTFVNQNFVVKKTIQLNTSIGESEEPLVFDENTLFLIKEEAQNNIVQNSTEVIKKLQDLDADILGVTTLYEKKYEEGSEFAFMNTQFIFDVTVEIEGSSDIKNAL
jgi:Ger(x)C family germination protein